MRGGHTSHTALWLAAGGLTAWGCGEENLQDTRPRVAVCVQVDAPDAECNRSLTLGDRPVTATYVVPLVVHNRGDGTLTVDDAKLSNPSLGEVREFPRALEVNTHAPLVFAVTPRDEGPGGVDLELTTNDPDHGHLVLRVDWYGKPKPVPDVVLCPDAAAPLDGCGTDITVDLGVVRRTQRESRTVLVRNRGNATLQITDVRRVGGSSLPDELVLVTSTRAGYLLPGAEAPLVFLYEPADGVADQLSLEFSSDDPDTPLATLTFRATSTDNFAPVAVAHEAISGAGSVEVIVGEPLVVDGLDSTDPEGDPLHFGWTLISPATSLATLDDPTAARVSFTPDRAGSYRVELVVTDSLGLTSAPPATVLVRARPRYALRAELQWTGGGDVDLHLVPQGEALFSSLDCYFAQPRPAWGTAGTADDPSLLDDSEAAPGAESLVIATPQDGTYALYAHYFDDAGRGPAFVTARVIFNDLGTAALQVSQSLPGSCSTWHVGDVTFPSAAVVPGSSPLAQQCR